MLSFAYPQIRRRFVRVLFLLNVLLYNCNQSQTLISPQTQNLIHNLPFNLALTLFAVFFMSAIRSSSSILTSATEKKTSLVNTHPSLIKGNIQSRANFSQVATKKLLPGNYIETLNYHLKSTLRFSPLAPRAFHQSWKKFDGRINAFIKQADVRDEGLERYYSRTTRESSLD